MATIKLGSFITDIRGSVGGTIFSRNANASYAKNFTKPTNPNTTKQQEVRGVFSQVAQAWRELTQEQREAWIAAAAQSEWSYTNKVGESSQYTGSQLYFKLNNGILQFDPEGTPFAVPPVPQSLTAIFEASMTAGEVAGLTGSINNTTALPANQFVRLSSTGPVSPGVYRPKNFKIITTAFALGGTLSNVQITDAYNAVFGDLIENQVVWFRFETFSTVSGQIIPGIEVRLEVAA